MNSKNNRFFPGRGISMNRLLRQTLTCGLLMVSFISTQPLYGDILAGPLTNAANQHVYLLLTPSSWTDSEAQAVGLGGHLATIRNAEENAWIYTNFANAGGAPHHMWIGLYRTDWWNGYQWISGEALNYTHWASGEPNNCDGIEDRGIIFGPEYEQYGIATFWNDVSDAGIGGCGGGDLAPCGLVELDGPPVIMVQPADQAARAGTDVTFSVVATGGSLSYQWLRNGKELQGATDPSLVVTNVQQGIVEGDYSVIVGNNVGTAVSSNAVLKVIFVYAYGNNQLITSDVACYYGSVTVQLQNAYANGPIFYTLDGSTPDFTSMLYTNAFVLTNSVILRALGYNLDFLAQGELKPTAILIVPKYTLSATTPGGGSISLSPSGGSYLSNEVVTVTAKPNSGWAFLYWLGDMSGTNASGTITMTRNKNVQAVFGTALNTVVSGNGVVTRDPQGDLYPYGTVVALTAVPWPGSVFGLWGNAASGSTNPLYYAVTTANRTVSSLFASLGANRAALAVEPTGFGRVSISPQANSFILNSSVTLTAIPDKGQSFLGWTGDVTSTENPLSLNMDQSKVIVAVFSARPVLSTTTILDGLVDGTFRFTVGGEFGRLYQVEFSMDLLHWQPLGTLTTTYGRGQYVDSPADGGHRFYRAAPLP